MFTRWRTALSSCSIQWSSLLQLHHWLPNVCMGVLKVIHNYPSTICINNVSCSYAAKMPHLWAATCQDATSLGKGSFNVQVLSYQDGSSLGSSLAKCCIFGQGNLIIYFILFHVFVCCIKYKYICAVFVGAVYGCYESGQRRCTV